MKKLMLRLIVLTISLLFCNFNVYAKEEEKQSIWVISEDGVNIRTSPRVEDSTYIDTVEYGTELEFLKESCIKDWYLIKYNGKIRYVIKEWVSFEEPISAAAPIEGENNPEPIQNEPAAANLTYYGSCFITHYCPCPICCGVYATGYTANGSLATDNWTVATGEDLPFGTKLLINGQTYEVQDRGVNSGCVDIFCSSHDEALTRGAYYTDVYIIN